MNKSPYFGIYDFEQVVGDALSQGFDLSVDGVPFSFTNYTLAGEMKDTKGNVVAVFTFQTLTTAVPDDTVKITVLPANMPTRTGLYTYGIRYGTGATDTKTLVFGKIALIGR